MKVSYQWLSEYVDLSGYSAADLAEKLTRSGIEVDVVESRNKGVQNVIVGYVKTQEKHPDADKLSVCTVETGAEDLQIVCGAPNVAAGQKVPVAVIGGVLPGDFKIKKAKLRGVESQGMICSAKELGMNDRLLPKEIQEGILVLPEEAEVGANAPDLLGLNDEVMELDLTPNRSDALSMIGVAYEIAAILGRDVKLPEPQLSETAEKTSEHISVRISAKEECQHYAARLVRNVKIGSSPLWMQNRLMAAGIRPINNIVDITNYVMLEYGQPLHAFDADRLDGGRINVRLAGQGEKIVTLDGTERELEPTMLLITDGAKPVAIAGVMGGANSEVTQDTKHILLEAAKFSGASVRKTSRKLGLRSESSLRFEKEVNPEAVIPALQRAAELMVQYAGGEAAEGIVEERTIMPEPLTINLSLAKVNKVLGTHVTIDEIKQIMNRLKFSFEADLGNELVVTVPKRRGDISRDVDLIEEVARLYGYDHIPTTLISGATTPGSLTKEQSIRRSIRRLLTDSGLHEVVNYSFTHPGQINEYKGLYPESRPIQLAMPMSEERSTLRTSLIPHLLDTAVYNRYRNISDVAVFEIGNVFVTDQEQIKELPEEHLMLAVLWTGSRKEAHWTGKPEKVDFYDLKGLFDSVAAYLGIQGVEYRQIQVDGLHPGRAAEILINKEGQSVSIGRIGQLHPNIQNERDLDDTYVLEIELETLYRFAEFQIDYRPLPRYPSIARDIAVVIDDAVAVGEVINAIRRTGGGLLESVDVFDLYKGERLGEGKKSIAFSLVFRHNEKTLTDEEVSALHADIVSKLEQSFAAELRK
jgi:phenylalanyl-tRNA synthetase beta chain